MVRQLSLVLPLRFSIRFSGKMMKRNAIAFRPFSKLKINKADNSLNGRFTDWLRKLDNSKNEIRKIETPKTYRIDIELLEMLLQNVEVHLGLLVV